MADGGGDTTTAAAAASHDDKEPEAAEATEEQRAEADGAVVEPDDGIEDLGVVELQVDESIPELQVASQITPFLLENLEDDAQKLAESVTHMLGGLETNIHALTMISSKYIETHEMAVNNLADKVDDSVDNISKLIVKCKDITENMKPVEEVVNEIRAIKKRLDGLEHAMNNSS